MRGPDGRTLSVIDFGQTKELDTDTRLSLARITLALAAAWGIVAYARRALNDPGFDQNIVEQMPVGALAGVGAAIAVAAGVSVAVFGG